MGLPQVSPKDLLGPMMIVTIPKVVSAPEKFQRITLLQDTVYPPLDGKLERGCSFTDIFRYLPGSQYCGDQLLTDYMVQFTII